MYNINEILSLSGIEKNAFTVDHAKKISCIYKFVKENIKGITSCSHTETSFAFGRVTDREFKDNEWHESVRYEGEQITGFHIAIKLGTGNYKFCVPSGAVADMFFNLLGIETATVQSTVTKAAAKVYNIPAAAYNELKKAKVFASHDDLRPRFQTVCMEITSTTVQLICTDCTRLYMSELHQAINTLPENTERITLLLPVSDMKKMNPVKADSLELLVYEDLEYSLGGISGKLLDESFADWRCVVPGYSTYFEVSRTNLIEQIKKILPYTNKSTNQVAIFVYDQILLYGCDIDFDFEMKCRLSYTQKQVVDFQIAVNGKLMMEVLKNFKSDTIKVYSGGAENKALILSNGIESILIMPLLYNTNGNFDEIVDTFLKEGSIKKTGFISEIKPQNTTATVKPTTTTQKRPKNEDNAAAAPVISINQSNFTQQIESICEKYQNVVFHIYDDKISIRFMKYENRQVITGSLAAEKPTQQQLIELHNIAAKFNKSVNDKTSKKTA